MRYLSICSGIEAASAAWHGEPLNWTPAGFAEIEPFPCAVLKHHYPEAPNLGDMTAPDFIDRCKALGPVEVLIGGTPCQAFSVAGLRNSLNDARGNLTLRFVEIVHAVGAAFTVWENVPGVLNTKDNAFGCFLAGLVGADAPLVPAGKRGRWTDAGLVVGPQGAAAWRILDAQYFGLAQRRRRVFVVFCPAGGADPAEILFESEGLQRYSDPRPKARQGAAADTPASVAIRGRGDGRNIEIGDPDCANALLTPNGGRDGMGPGARIAPGDGLCVPCADTPSVGANQTTGTRTEVVAFRTNQTGAQGPIHSIEQTDTLSQDHPPAVAFQQNYVAMHETGQGFWQEGEVSGTLRAEGENRPSRPSNVVAAFPINTLTMGGRPDPVNDLRMTSGIGDEGDPQFTLQAAHSHAVATAMQVRRLTPVECERLQGFPDNYTQVPYRNKPAADGPRYKALGNSMAVPVIRWIGQRINLAQR